MIIRLLAVWLLIASFALAQPAENTLVSTNVIFRHGDRAAVAPLPIDRVNETFWKYGYGELTDFGKEQHYKVGKLLHTRYEKILLEEYYYKNIEVRSSDVDRCLISAYSQLSGLFSNSTKQSDDLQLPFIRWQPVPAHSVPVIADELLAMGRPCNAAEKSKQEAGNSQAVQQINKDYAEFFKMVARETGLNLSNNAFNSVWPARDTLFCESVHGLPPPAWTNQTNISCNSNSYIPCEGKSVWDIMKEMSSLQFVVMYNSSVLHHFDGGPLLDDISAKFQNFVAGKRTIKYNMYSGHDTTVAATLSALGIFDAKAPQYASTILIELHKTGDKKYEVRIFYKNVTDDDAIHPIELPECKDPCSLESFTNMLKKYAIKDWDEACGNNPTTTSSSTTTSRPSGLTPEEIIVITICSAVVLCLLVILLFCCLRRRRTYQSLNHESIAITGH